MTPTRKDSLFARTIIGTALMAALLGVGSPALAVDAKAARFYEDALARYEKKDLAGAIIQLKNALQIDPTMLPVQLLLGRALMKNGEVVAAEVALAEALRLGVNRAEVVLLLGRCYMLQGKHKAMLEQQQFSPAGLPKPTQLQLYLLRAAAFSDMGDARAAMNAVEEARAIDPLDADTWSAEVPLRIRARQFREGLAAAERAISLKPKQASGWYQKGSVLHVQGDLAGALAAYEQAVKLDPEDVEPRVTRAGILIDQDRMADAGKELVEMQKLAPEDPRGAYLRALLAERKGDTATAQAAMKEVVDLIDPVPIEFIRYRPQLLMLNGLSHFGLNEREKAKQYLEAFQRAMGGSAASKALAQIYIAESNADRAIEVLEGYLKTHPADGMAMAQLGSAYLSKGQNAKAATLMQEALKTRDTPEFRTVLGMSLIRSGQSESGAKELELAFKKSPAQVQAGTALFDLHMRSGDLTRAIVVAENLVKQFPSNAVFYNLLGTAQARAGQGPAARKSFEQALKLDPASEAAKLNMARFDMATGALDSATKRLDAILKENPKSVDAMAELSVVAERRGQTTDAQRWLEKAEDQAGPKELRWGLALVEFFLRNRQPDMALQAAKRVSARAPDNLQVLIAYGRAQLAIGDSIGARNTFTGATRFAAYDAPRQVEIALLQLAAKNPDGAFYSLDKILANQPDYLPAAALMADVELRRNEPAKAEKRARDIIAKYPQRAIGYSLLGDVAKARAQFPMAVDNYRRAHQLEPSSDTMLRLFGALQQQDGGRPAIQLLEQWLKTHPKDVMALRSLGDAYARQGNHGAARKQYEAVVKLAPNDSATLNNLANVLLRLKDPSASKVAEQAVAADASNANAIDTLGWILFQNKQADKALTLLRSARLREPGNAEIRYHLGVVLAQAGRKTEATEELDAAVKLAPSAEFSGDAKRLLQSLR